MSEEERVGALNKQKEDEMKKLDLETVIDEKEEGMRQLKKKKEDHEEERKLGDEYLEKYRQEEGKRKREGGDNDDDSETAEKTKTGKYLSNSTEHSQTISNTFFSFLDD